MTTPGRPTSRWASLYYESDAGEEVSCLLPLTPEADGRFRLPFVPAGRGALEHAQGSGSERSTTVLLELEIPARGTREVRVP